MLIKAKPNYWLVIYEFTFRMPVNECPGYPL